MTVSIQTNRTNQNGNGVTTTIPISFPFHSAADLKVLLVVISTGVQTLQTITTHYTIGGTPDALGHYSGGGSVDFLVAPTSLQRIVVYRDPARTQSLDLVENDNLPAESLEASIDYQTMLIQRVADLITRSLRQPDGDSANIGTIPTKVDRLGKYLYFNATTGEPEAADAVEGTVTVTSGNWTPSLGGNTTYTTQTGTWRKVGTEITVKCNLIINTLGTGSATTISGLPETVGGIGGVGAVRWLDLSQNVVSVIAFAAATGTAVILQSMLAAGVSVGSNNIIGNGTSITFQLTYTAA